MKLKTKLLSIDAATIGVIAQFIRFPSKFLQSFYVTQDVNCMNLVMTDTIFDSFKLFNDFIKARDWDAWVECQLQVELPGGPSLDLLNTGLFMPAHHTCYPMMMATPMATSQAQQPIGHPQSSSHVLAGEEEDDVSESDNEVTPLDWNSSMDDELLYMFKVNFKPHLDYNTRYRKQLTSGKQPNCQTFLGLDYRIIEGQMLHINDANSNLLLMFWNYMKDSMRDTLLHKMEYILSGQVKYVDTESEGINNIFGALRASWYLRFAKNGFSNPPRVEGKGKKRRGKDKISQEHTKIAKCFIKDFHYLGMELLLLQIFYTTEGWLKTCQHKPECPRLSKEIKDNQEVYQMLLDALHLVFEWIYATHAVPSKQHNVPVYPFTGFILNVNVSTHMHRDTGDKDICLVLVISDCIGGELVLVEPSVILRMRSGDVVVFPSKALPT
ncbi:hypothetical protein CPB84DRAFT_1830233 [Gymnopilus junonius]|uniref:Uncharacterized protein n=1 Tax=Gymnopilus junonius TaxID=109634 RepID=A0A9P5N710_GYMJU|nr:hypothetical protein CPB84DRAFT_1830233 [Gymnopilus junonius]